MYDITKRETFNHVDLWMDELKAKGPAGLVKIVVGNKSDLDDQRQVSTEQAEQYAKLNDADHIETSALDSSNVESAFLKIINRK